MCKAHYTVLLLEGRCKVGGATKIRAITLELAPPVRLMFRLPQRPKILVSFLKIEERDSHSG